MVTVLTLGFLHNSCFKKRDVVYIEGWKKQCKTLTISHCCFGERVIKMYSEVNTGLKQSYFHPLKLVNVHVYPYFPISGQDFC